MYYQRVQLDHLFEAYNYECLSMLCMLMHMRSREYACGNSSRIIYYFNNDNYASCIIIKICLKYRRCLYRR